MKGERGAARPVRASRHGWDSLEEFLKYSNDETVLIPLIETARGINNFQQLIGIKEIDAFCYGYFEMSLTMGFGGQINDEMIKIEDFFYDLCKKNSKPIADYRTSIPEAERVIQKGCKILLYSADLIYTSEKYKELAKEIKTKLKILS
jgi:2-keto-3-deoxy-L-rhamnonate aldolase RhmA